MTPTDPPDLSGDSTNLRPFRLVGQSKILYAVLVNKDKKLANIYYGGLAVMYQTSNSETFAQAAHSFRELMDEIPKYYQIESINDAKQLQTRTQSLRVNWEKTVLLTKTYNNGKWNGKIDKSLKIFLIRFNKFIQWLKNNMPKGSEIAVKTIRKMDDSGIMLPGNVEKKKVTEWMQIREYFINVLHHNLHNVTVTDIYSKIEQLEEFLLGFYKPPRSDEFDEIDNLIETGESID